MAKPTRAFGQVADDYDPEEYGDDVWIRNFKNVSTQVRILPAVSTNASGEKVFGSSAWPTEREHFKDNLSFPCGEPLGLPCPGCSDDSEKVRSRSRRYYVNVLDEEGEQRVWRFPSSLYKTLAGREQRMLAQDPDNKQPLSDRDYIVNKMGKGMDTTYDPEPGDKYEVDFPEEVHDIPPILQGLYEQAIERFGGGSGSKSRGEYIDEIEEEPEEKPKASGLRRRAAAAPTEEKPDKRKKAIEDDDEPPALSRKSSKDDFEEADTASIKAFLDNEGIEYPPRAQRKRLIEIALDPPF